MRTACVSASQRASTVWASARPAVKLRVTESRLAVPSALKRHVVSLELAEPSSARKYRMRRHVPTTPDAMDPPPLPAIPPAVPLEPSGTPRRPLSQAVSATTNIRPAQPRPITPTSRAAPSVDLPRNQHGDDAANDRTDHVHN